MLTTVSVLPDVTSAAENGGDGFWKIQRTPVDGSSVVVNFSISGDAISDQDYEPITVTSVTIPPYESYTLLQLEAKDDIWWEITESVVLTIQSGSYTIGTPDEASLSIISDDFYPPELVPFFMEPIRCDCPCTCATASAAKDKASGNVTVETKNQITHSSHAASGQVVVGVNGQFTAQAEFADDMVVTTKLDGLTGPTAYYAGADEEYTDYQVSVPIDVRGVGIEEDGYYEWELEITEHYPISPDLVRDADGRVKVFTFAGGEFGPGWLPSGVDRLKRQGGTLPGVLWIRGDYNAYWFDETSADVFERQYGEPDYSTLTVEGDGSITLRKKTGETLNFVESGVYYMLTTRTDRNGNETTYTYVDADGQDGDDEIETITDPAGRVTTFNYTGTRVTSITDPYGRVTDLEYTSGNLSKIKEPDPDGAGSLTRPETNFTYNGDDQIASITDAEGSTTSYSYVNKMIRTVTHPGGGVETLKVQFGRAIEDGIGAPGSLRPHYLTSDVFTEYENEVENTWFITFNGYGSAVKIVDPQGQVTTYAFNSENLLTSIVEPDPDGNPDGTYPQIEPQTTFAYDARLNMTEAHYPDGSDELWVYESDFNQVTSYTNRRNKLTTFTVDSTNGNTTQIVQVADGGSNNSVWDLTYTDAGIMGLIETIEDPRNYTTEYAYTAGGLIDTITHPDNSEETFDYDSYENLVTYTDEIGRETDYTWDLLDRLLTITLPDPDGGGGLSSPVYTYEYNKNNYLKKETDPLGHFTEYSYNGRLDLVEVKEPDPDGAGSQAIPTTTYAYDAHRRLTSVTDPLGRVTTYAYDTLDRTASVTLPDPDGAGGQTSSVYSYLRDHIGRVTQITDPMSNVTLLDHATWNRVAYTLPDPDGEGGEGSSTVVDLWNANGQFTSHTDELSRTSGYSYDDLGRVGSISRPGGISTSIVYDKSSNVTSVTNPRGYTTAYEYDSRNRLVEVTEADPDDTGPLASPVWTYVYNDAGDLLSMTDPRGYVTTYAYDGIGRLITVTEPDPDGGGSQTSPVTTYTYDAASRLTTVTDPLGNVTTYGYDNLDRLISVVEADPDGAGGQSSPVTTYTYDLVGNLLTVTDPLSRTTTYTYDGLDRLTSVAEPSPGGTTSYTYDKVSNLTSVTDPLSHTTTYEYNNRYFLVEVTQPTVAAGTPVWTYTVDGAGQVLEVEDPLERVTVLEYDGLGRISSVTRPDPDGVGPQDAPETTYGYDANSNLTSMTDARGSITNWVYDGLDRLTQIKRPQAVGEGTPTGPTTTYAYDAAGNLTSVADPLSRVTTYAYDGLNRRTTVTQPDPDGGGGLTSPVTTFAYDAVGNVTSITDPRGNVTTRTLDNLYRQITVTQPDPDGGGGLSSPVTTFTYDAASQLLSVTDPLSRVTSYEYNGLGLNTKITEPDPDGAGGEARPETTFAYDAMRNLTSVTDPLSHATEYTYDALYRNTRITDANDGETDFTYDLVGNLLTLTDPVENTTAWTYDGLDRAIEEENELAHSRLFEYDATDNLTRKTDRNGRVTEYVYDNLNRNLEEIWIDDEAPAASVGVSTTTQGSSTNEVQRVGFSATFALTGGTFTLSFGGQTTGNIAYNASAATVQTALEGLSSIGSGNVSVTKYANTGASQIWEVTFQGSLANTNVSQMTVNSTNVTYSGPMKVNTQTTITEGGAGVNEVQVVTETDANGGSYTLSFGGQTTDPIAWNAAAGTVDAALEALSTIDTVSVSGSSGGPYTITFTGSHAGQNVAQLTADGANLTNTQIERTLAFEYDAAGQLTAADDPAAEYAYVYDNLGRVTQQTQTIAGLTPEIVFDSAYDAAGNRLSLAATIGANADFLNEYVYDALNRMTQVIQQSNSGNTVGVKRVDLTYNAAGQFDVISRFQSTDTSAPVATSHYGYDGMGRLTDLDHKTNGGGTTLAAYDYTFDAASRITSVDSLIDGLSEFTYDVTNQLTDADHASQPDEDYSFDLNGNRTMASHTVGDNNQLLSDGTYDYEYDGEGNRISRTNISTDDVTEYEWDHRNRLVKVTEKDDMGIVQSTTENAYDAFDRWIRHTFDADGPGGSDPVDTFFIYEENQIVLQFDGDDDGDLSHRYLWGPDVDQFFADEQVTSLASAGNVLWGLGDHQGSLRDIADRNEGSGVTTVTNHREYQAFGALTGETNAAVDLLFGYTGRALDETTGLQDNWHRKYDPLTGSWLSEDPIGFEAGDANLRRYVENHATGLTDPSGLDEEHKKDARPSTKEKHQRGQGRRAADQARSRMREERRSEAIASQEEIRVKIKEAVEQAKSELEVIEKRLKRSKDCFEISALESRKAVIKQEIKEMNSIIVHKSGGISKETVEKLSVGTKSRLATLGLVLSVVVDVGDAVVWYLENAPVAGHPGTRIAIGEYTWHDEGGSFKIRVEDRWTFSGVGFQRRYYYKDYYCGAFAGQSFEISRETKEEYLQDYKRRNGYFRWQWYYWEWVPGTERKEPDVYYDFGNGLIVPDEQVSRDGIITL